MKAWLLCDPPCGRLPLEAHSCCHSSLCHFSSVPQACPPCPCSPATPSPCSQIIAIVVADTQEHARSAARAVKVAYEDLPAVTTIADAVRAGSFLEFPFSGGSIERCLAAGDDDVDAVLADVARCERTVEGEVGVGGQEHFYLEPNSCLVWPVDGRREIHMICSTQVSTRANDLGFRGLLRRANSRWDCTC